MVYFWVFSCREICDDEQRPALLSAMEQLPGQHDVRLPPAADRRGLRRRHPRLQ